MFKKGRIVGFLLTGVFLWLAARNVDGSELAAAFAKADYRFVVPAALSTLAGYILRSARWQRIVKPEAPLPFGAAFGILMMGFAANNVLPARLGEVVRAHMLRRRTGARKTYGMATIFLERLCDGLTLILFLGVISLAMPLPSEWQTAQWIASAIFLAGAVAIVLLLVREHLIVSIANPLLGRLPDRLAGPLLRAMEVFILGLHALRSRRSVAYVVVVSVAVWLLEATSYLSLITAFDIHLVPDVPVLAAGFLLVVVNLGIMIPSGPGYIGTFQAAAIGALAVFGVAKETALAVAILSHGMQWLLVTLIGLAFFAREHVGLYGIERQAEAESDEEIAATPAGGRR